MQASHQQPSPVQSSIEENKSIVKAFFDRFSAGDVSGVTDLLSDDATYWFPSSRKYYSKTEFADAVTWIYTRLDGPITFEMGEMVAEGERVCVLMEGFAKTLEGKAYNNLYNVYFELESGKIKRVREYNDTAHVLSTMYSSQAE